MYNLEQDTDLEIMRDGHPIEAMEAAKRIIGYEFPRDVALIERLADIATNPEERMWARIAAVYTIGFINADNSMKDRLQNICVNPDEIREIIEHVDEAIAHMEMRDGFDDEESFH